MSKDLNKKEQHFKDLLDNLEMDLNTDELWSSVSAELPQKRKRYGLLSFSLLFVAMLLTGFFVGKYYGTGLSSQGLEAESEKGIESEFNEIVELTEFVNDPKGDNNRESETEKNSERGINAEANKPEREKELEKGTETELEEFVEFAEFLKEVEAEEIRVSNETGELKKLNEEAELVLNDVKRNSTNNRSDITSQTKIIFDSKKQVSLSAKPFNKKKRKTHTFLNIDYLTTVQLGQALISKSLVFDNARISTSIVPIYQDNWKPFLRFQLGLNHNNSRNILAENSEGLDAQILGLENDKMGFNSEIGVGLFHASGWRISGGLSYSSFFSSMSSNEVEITSQEVAGTETIIINPDGSQTLIAGTLQQTSSSETSFLWHRRHKRLDVQIGLGKSLMHWKHLSIGIEAGLRYNVWASDRGYFFDNNLEFTKLTEGVESPYKNRHGLGFSSAVNIEYAMGRYIVGINPFLRYNPNSISKASHIYLNKNHQVGLNASLFYLFD